MTWVFLTQTLEINLWNLSMSCVGKNKALLFLVAYYFSNRMMKVVVNSIHFAGVQRCEDYWSDCIKYSELKVGNNFSYYC